MILQPASNILVPFMQPQFRRGRGGAGFVPTDIAGCLLWLDAAQIVGLGDGDPVDTWLDLSGNANDATGSLTERPTYQTNEINGKPVVRFDGSDDFMSTVDTVSDPITFFFLGQIVSFPGGGNRTFVGLPLSFAILAYYTSGGNIAVYGGSSVVSSGSVAANTPFVGSFILDGASSSVQINNNSAATGDAGAGTSGILSIGKNTGGEFGNIDILQLIAYDSPITGADLDDVKNYLASEGGVSL